MRTEEFYAFMREREAIRLRKAAGQPWPWTDDPVLQAYKFTNVKREHDRTTVELRKVYAEKTDRPAEEKLLNCAAYRYFGTYEHARAMGWCCDMSPGNQARLIALARDRMARKERVFTGAYVITNQGIARPKEEVVVERFLGPLWAKADWLVHVARGKQSWRDLITAMRTMVPGFGGTGFMAKEVVLDLAFCDFWRTPDGKPFDKDLWCPAGPGARRGINRVLGRDPDTALNDEGALNVMKGLFAARVDHWPRDYVELELHDIQFQCCEVDKYWRTQLGEGKPRSRYRPPKEAV